MATSKRGKASRREQERKKAKARERAAAIIAVRTGQMTATDAAKSLGVSRKTYYKWENRALLAMSDMLTDLEAGRPPETPEDETIAALKAENASLQAEIKRLKDEATANRMLTDLQTRLQTIDTKKNA